MKLLLSFCVVLTCAVAIISTAPAAHQSRAEVAGSQQQTAAKRFLSQLQRESAERRVRRQGSGSSTEATTSSPVTLPGGATLPTIPENFTLPTIPGDLTLPTLPSTLPSITTPSLPGGSTLPSDATIPSTLPTLPPDFTVPTLPSTIPNPTLPENFTFPTIPSTITVPTLPDDLTTLPTLPFNLTFPPEVENATIPTLNITIPPFNLENFTLPTIDLENVTLPPINLENFTLPPLENLTLPPQLENLTFPPDFTFPTVLPTALSDLLTQLVQGNVPSLDSLISSALTTDVTGECGNGWTRLFNQSVGGVSNGLRAVDSFGKLGAGYLRGNRYALGDYDQCFSLSSTQYCLSDLIVRLNDGNVPDPELLYAICLPKSCSNEDITNAISSTNDQLEFLNISIEISSISCEEETKTSYNAGAALMIVIWVLIGLIIIGATSFHVFVTTMKRHRNTQETMEINEDHSINNDDKYTDDKKSKVFKLVLAFSLCKSVPSLLSTERPDPKLDDITSLHGLKVMSLLWVILGHTHLWAIFFDSHTSYVYQNVVPRFSYQAVLSSPFGFDSFFLLSGILVTYVALNRLAAGKSKKKYVKLAAQYLRQVLHFSPVYAVVLFTYWLLTVHFADGPLWQRAVGVDSSLYENCKENWWTNFFYINNFHPWANLDQCMPWAWYVASEFQFFIAAPLLVVPLALVYPLGLVITIVLLIGNVILLGALTGGYDLSASIFLDLDLSRPIVDENIVVDGRNSIDDIHTKPWARIGPFLLGIILGFVLFKKIKPFFRRPINHIIYACLWVIAFGLCFATVYGTYGAFDDGGDITEGEAIVYQMFSRITWSLGLSIVIFACHNGYGWVANDFLSMKFWTPLSRLSLLVYLIHPVVLFVLFYSRRAPVYGTDITLAVYTIATVVLSYGAAGIVAAFVDFPLRLFEDTVLGFVGLAQEDKDRVRRRTEEENRQMAEEGVVGHENYYFSELERAEQKRMEAEEGDAEEDAAEPEKPLSEL